MSTVRGVILQYFHWYTEGNGVLWNQLKDNAQAIADAGFTALWLPPAYKGAAGASDTGYGVYDLYDLGEFDQKGSVATKYGTKEEYLQALQALKKHQLAIYTDIVLNHRMGADETEQVLATAYDKNNRLQVKDEQIEVTVYTRFTFPGREEKYSDFQWMWHHFDAVDHTTENPDDHETIYVFEGKQFDEYVSDEFGNYDYLMGCDLDFGAEEVREELIRWGKWYSEVTSLDGYRIDAVKHIPSWFFPQWLEAMRSHAKKELFAVAELWDNDLAHLSSYIEQTERSLSLFDVPLHFKFYQAGIQKRDFDLSTIFDGTLVQQDPDLAVTFVANHDSQALQALESVVEPWFKPLAYALILLRKEGYPCVFIADYEGAKYTDFGNDGNEHTIEMPSFKNILNTMLALRSTCLDGEVHDYFDHPNTIAWSFIGEKSLAVVLSNGEAGSKRMPTGKAKTRFLDVSNNIKDYIETDEEGFADFHCNTESVSLWVNET